MDPVYGGSNPSTPADYDIEGEVSRTMEKKKEVLQLEERAGSRKGPARRLRASGFIPGVVYASQEPTVQVQLKTRDLTSAIKKAGRPILDIRLPDGRETLATIQEFQHDPVNDRPLHVDFHMIKEGEKVTIEIPLVTAGDCKGVKLGGVIDTHMRSLEVRGLPAALPENLVVNVSEMDIGDSVKLRDIVLPEGAEFLGELDWVVISVVPPMIIAEKPAAAAEEGAEAPAEKKEEAKE